VIFSSLGMAVAVVDRRGRVKVWNRRAEDLWGVRQEEALDQHFLGLDIGLRPERLASSLRAVMGGGERQTTILEAVNRRGKAIRCAVAVLPLQPGSGEDGQAGGAIVLMEDESADGARFRVHTADFGVDGAG